MHARRFRSTAAGRRVRLRIRSSWRAASLASIPGGEFLYVAGDTDDKELTPESRGVEAKGVEADPRRPLRLLPGKDEDLGQFARTTSSPRAFVSTPESKPSDVRRRSVSSPPLPPSWMSRRNSTEPNAPKTVAPEPEATIESIRVDSYERPAPSYETRPVVTPPIALTFTFVLIPPGQRAHHRRWRWCSREPRTAGPRSPGRGPGNGTDPSRRTCCAGSSSWIPCCSRAPSARPG